MEIIKENVTYGEAIDWILSGNKAKRANWGGYWFIPEIPVALAENGITHFFNPFIVACLKDNGGYAPATPYAEDTVAVDWVLLK